MSKQRNFRPRAKLNLGEDEEDARPPQLQPAASNAAAQPPKAPKPPSQSGAAASKPNLKTNLLSFEEDGEGEDAGRPLNLGKKKDKDKGKSKFRGGELCRCLRCLWSPPLASAQEQV
jgi:hypothetical protein